MIKITNITTDRVAVTEEGEEYVYPRFQFPEDVHIDMIVERESGVFVEAEDE